MLRKVMVWFLAAALWLMPQAAFAFHITPEQIKEMREQSRRAVEGSSGFADTIAGVINMTLSPDLSSAWYTVKWPDEPDLDFSTTKLPIYHVFAKEGRSWSPYLGVVLGYFTAEEAVIDVSSTFGEKMRWDNTWTGYSGLLEGGVKLELGQGFYLAPGVSAGVARLRNKTTFLNDFSREVVAPVLDGLSTNFTITALMLSGILGAGYDTKLGALDLEVVAKYTHSYVETIETDNPAQEFNSDIDSVAGRFTLGGPLGCSLAGHPLLWQAFLGGMHFLGQDQDVLGWTYYGELGGTIGLDIRRLGLPVSALRLGASIIQGDNISGWSIVLGYTF